MRIGLDMRTMHLGSGKRGVGYYLRGLVSEIMRQAQPEDEFVFFLMEGRPEVSWAFLPPEMKDKWHTVRLPEACSTKARWIGRVPRVRRYQNQVYQYVDRHSLSIAVKYARIDLLHLPTLFEPEFFADGNFACPTVKTLYDLILFLDVYQSINNLPGHFLYLLQKQLPTLRSADAVVAISQSAADDLEKLLPGTSGKAHVIYPGVGNEFAPASPASQEQVRRRLGLGRHYFVFSGGMDARKNLGVAVEALGLAFGTQNDIQLVVKGKVEDYELQRIMGWAWKAGLPPGAVKVPGFVPDADLVALYSGASALVFPSRYEGFGLPVVEAMKCGCPVITARNSSLAEAAGDAALYADDADDALALAEAMRRIIQEPALAEDLRAKGLAHAAQFTWQGAARAHWDLYRRLAGALSTGSLQQSRRVTAEASH